MATVVDADLSVSQSYTVEFLHDATAAAAVGTPDSATIVLGTWPGSGFRPAVPAPRSHGMVRTSSGGRPRWPSWPAGTPGTRS